MMETPFLETPFLDAFEQRRKKHQKRLIQYPIRVRQVKRLRGQIRGLNRALVREKAYSDLTHRQYTDFLALQDQLRDSRLRVLEYGVSGVLAGFLLGLIVR